MTHSMRPRGHSRVPGTRRSFRPSRHLVPGLLLPVLASLLVTAWAFAAWGDAGPRTGTSVVLGGTVTEDVYAAGETVQISAKAAGDVVAAGGNVTLTGDTAGNVIVAGGNLDVGRRVGQNLIAAGGNVQVSGRVDQDVLAAGGNVQISGRMGDDVRAAGGTVGVTASVRGDLVAAGGDVTLAPGAQVAGRAWLAGGRAEVAGAVGGELRVRSAEVRVSGTVGKDAELTGETIEVTASARIGGKLIYASPREARIDPGAKIAGGVERRPLPPGVGAPGVPWGGVVFGVLAVLVALFATATVVRFTWPGFSLQSAATLVAHPWKSLALGFALLVCIPAAALVLFSVLIGAPLALALVLLYPIALALGLIVVAVLLAEAFQRWFFGRTPVPIGWRVLLLWAAVLLLALVCGIPVVGQLVLLVALLLGLGAVGLHLAARYAGGGTAPPMR